MPAQLIQTQDLTTREKVLDRGSLIIGIVFIAGAILRYFVAQVNVLSISTTFTMGALLLFIPLFRKWGMSLRAGVIIVLLAIDIIVLNAGMFNGGVRAPAVQAMILMPIFGFISSGEWGAKIGVMLAASSLGVLVYSEYQGWVSPLVDPEQYSYYKAAIMSMGIVVTYLIGSMYEKIRRWSEERLLQLTSELYHQSKMSALGEMAGGISHEINNPLSIIVTRAALLRKKIELGQEVSLTAIQGELSSIEDTARRISKIINGMKTLSRKADADPMVKVFVSQLLDDVYVVCRERFRQNVVDLRIVNQTKDLEIECQSALIAQVIVNLLSNAFDAVEKLPEKWVELKTELRDGFFCLSVTDSGRGIPAPVVQKMMEPFFTTKEVGKGMGLGLSISSRIVESHGGAFYYDATSEHTRFVMRLPLKAKVE